MLRSFGVPKGAAIFDTFVYMGVGQPMPCLRGSARMLMRIDERRRRND